MPTTVPLSLTKPLCSTSSSAGQLCFEAHGVASYILSGTYSGSRAAGLTETVNPFSILRIISMGLIPSTRISPTANEDFILQACSDPTPNGRIIIGSLDVLKELDVFLRFAESKPRGLFLIVR